MSKLKILVVDDDPKLSALLAFVLNRLGGYDVCEENRSYAALATTRRFRPDVILLDVDMPGKDGGMVASEIRKDVVVADTPIIFVSSLITKSEEGLRNGSHYLSKPVEPHHLLATVRELCGRVQPDLRS